MKELTQILSVLILKLKKAIKSLDILIFPPTEKSFFKITNKVSLESLEDHWMLQLSPFSCALF